MLQKESKKSSILSLIAANSVPLAGVLFFGWSISSIMFIFWSENVIIGVFNLFRMIKAEKPMPAGQNLIKLNGRPYMPQMKPFLIIFFIIHYGIFTLVHGIFIIVLFNTAQLSWPALLAGPASLFISHFISYRANFVGNQEYKNVSAPDLFSQLYKRIIILHLAIIFGGFGAQAFGAPVSALVILVALKIAIDLWLHNREHLGFMRADEAGFNIAGPGLKIKSS